MDDQTVIDSATVSGSFSRSPPGSQQAKPAPPPASPLDYGATACGRPASHGRMDHQTEPTMSVALTPSNDNLRLVPYIKKLSMPVISSPSPSPVYTHTDDDAKTATTTITKLEAAISTKCETWSTTSSEQPICRICHDSLDENGKSTLVSPCGCTGSAQFTHKKCLQKWTGVKGATTCEICHKGYKPKYIRLRQKLLTRQVMCMGSAASLPLLIVIIVGFFLLGEQLSIGTYGRDSDHGGQASSNDMVNSEDVGVDSDWDTSKMMVAICMIATATFGILLLCCFSVWAAHVQPQQIEGTLIDGGLFGYSETDVERNGSEVVTPVRRQRLPSASPLSSPSSPLSPTSLSSPLSSSPSSTPPSPSTTLNVVNIPVFYIYD